VTVSASVVDHKACHGMVSSHVLCSHRCVSILLALCIDSTSAEAVTHSSHGEVCASFSFFTLSSEFSRWLTPESSFIGSAWLNCLKPYLCLLVSMAMFIFATLLIRGALIGRSMGFYISELLVMSPCDTLQSISPHSLGATPQRCYACWGAAFFPGSPLR